MSFIRTGLSEIGLKIRRQKTRMALRHEKRLLQKSEVNLGREGCSQAVNFPEVRNEIVALKKLEQEQKEVALRIAQIEESIRKVELQRAQNTKEQNAALAKLEEEKKPVLEKWNDAKTATELCDRELAGVERRLQENDAADRELLKKLAELQAQVPPPADLEAQMAAIGARRMRLPDEKSEITRARLGSAEACRTAREKLSKVEAEVAVADKNITRIKDEYEARDRVLNENSRAQQDALKDARGHHQTVEEKKNPAYLNIGRHLASQGIAPPNAPHLLREVQKHRAAVERHLQHTAELEVLSSQTDKQELRKFYFSVVSLLILLAIILPLVFKSPPKREWLPQETEAILSVNTEQIERDDLPKRWRKDQQTEWQNLWSGLVGNAERMPVLNLSRDVIRVTRAMTIDGGAMREFVLVESRGDISQVIRSIERDKTFERRPISGLPVWIRSDFAIARVGPKTLAIGSTTEVEELVRVRLGIKPDLKTTGQLFDRFQALNQGNAFRLISRDPPKLPEVFHPVFTPELLEASQLLGLSLALQNPIKARMVLACKTPEQAAELSRRVKDEPQRWLRLQDSDLLLYSQPPEADNQGSEVLVRFDVPERAARLLLQRIAKTDAAAAIARN